MSESSGLGDQVWNRTGHAHDLSWTSFYALFFCSTIVGLATSAFMVRLLFNMHINVWVALLVGLVGGFAGIFISLGSKNAVISFLGLELLATSFGVMLTSSMQAYAIKAEMGGYDFVDLVQEAMMLTGAATVVMGVLGYQFSEWFKGLGGILFGALSALLVLMFGEIILSMFGFTFNSIWISWVAVIIFCGYIGYDIGRVTDMERNADNAVDSAVALYLDIVNLFLHIIRILAAAKK